MERLSRLGSAVMRTISIDQARRIALAAQGFSDPRPRGGVDVRHIRRVLGRIGLLQLDSVNVAVRSHYMPLFSRLGPYRMDLIDEVAYKRGELFEYWGHEASLLPMETYPLYRHRMEGARPWRVIKELLADDPQHVDQILHEVHEKGPITVADLRDPGERTGPWWGNSQGKVVLEWLFLTGKITCSHRRNFTRFYDVAERVIPADLLAGPLIEAHDARKEMLRMAVRHHGVGTATDLADYYRIRMPDARPLIKELVAEGEFVEVQVAGWDKPAYLDPNAKTPRQVRGSALLTPFDPVVWARDRAERLFDFHYRIEIYVPEPKRIYGYYVMPFLLDGELVARVDLKSDRKLSRLLVRGTFMEDGQEPSRVAPALAVELAHMASWLDLSGIDVADNGNLAGELRAAL